MLPVLLMDKIRVLAARDLFDCLELCLLGKREFDWWWC
jgi:hypothetical protein